MSISDAPWLPVAFGFFAGMLTVAALGRWLRVVLVLRQERRLAHTTHAQSNPRFLGIPRLAFAHPTPWLCLVGLPFPAYYFIHLGSSVGAAWFFAALSGVILLWLLATALLIWWYRKKRAAT
jgi:hypothetical protein